MFPKRQLKGILLQELHLGLKILNRHMLKWLKAQMQSLSSLFTKFLCNNK